MLSRIELPWSRQRLGDVVADEDRHQYEIRLKRQCVVSQDGIVFTRSGTGNAEVVHLDAGLCSLEQREVIVHKGDGGANREGIAESGNAIAPWAFCLLKIWTREAQAIAA